MRKHLVRLLKVFLQLILGLLAGTLFLALCFFHSQLNGIAIVLLFNLGILTKADYARQWQTNIVFLAISSLTAVLGIIIGCRSTITSCAVVEILLVLLIVLSDMLPDGHLLAYLLGATIVIFGLQLLYASLIKMKKVDTFVWATYQPNDNQEP